MSVPLVALVGRPNVGKSALFNRLAHRRIAIVEDTPGITRDRLYATADWRGHNFTIVDTGGIILREEDPMMVQVRRQAEIAMEEADVILYIADSLDGVTAADRELANAMRGSSVPVILVANKADNPRLELDATDFYTLGLGEVHAISALHGHGVGDLLDSITDLLPEDEGEPEDDGSVRMAIIGRPNVGKSSMMNAILGEDRVIVSPVAGTTRDAIDTRIERDGQPVVLVDTAGIRRTGKVQGSVEYYTVLRAKSAIERSHVCIVVIDAADGLKDGDKRVAGLAHEAGRACIVAVNKWDLVDPGMAAGRKPERAPMVEFTRKLRDELPFIAFAPIAFCSALQGSGISQIIDTALEAAANHAHRIPTGELNRLLREAVDAKPRLQRGKQLKVYYTTMHKVQPPTIVLFVNDPEMMHFSYTRYLENRIRAKFPLEGTPLVIQARRGEADEVAPPQRKRTSKTKK